MKTVEIYTDGACSGNPGVGGWCAILMYNGHSKIVSGYNKDTTNNRMEVFAAIQGLDTLKEPCIVNLYSDSAYLVNAINNNWLDGWQRNNWKGADKKEIKNIDLWLALLAKMKRHQVNFIKVKGHSDNEFNNKCDEVARGEISNCQKILAEKNCSQF
jgi:ribonuclease HI